MVAVATLIGIIVSIWWLVQAIRTGVFTRSERLLGVLLSPSIRITYTQLFRTSYYHWRISPG